MGLAHEDLIARGTADGVSTPPAMVIPRPELVTARAETAGPDAVKPEPTECTSEQLAERSKTGCLEAFEQLVRRYENRIFNFFRQFTGNHHDAEDLTQETFVKAHRAIQRFNSSFLFSAWLFTIARRTGASHFRSLERFEELPANEESQMENPAAALERKDEQGSIWRLARTLKPNQAQSLWLHYAEGFSIAETARIMRTTQIHVKVMLHRARSQLARKLTARGLFLPHRSLTAAHGSQSRADPEQTKSVL